MPLIYYNTGGCWVEFRKDIYNHDLLKEMGLNERQIKAVLYVKKKGRITNAEYQEINNYLRNTASSDLIDLVNKLILRGSDMKGAGAFYQLY